MTIHSVEEVFTPTTYATHTFVERNKINNKLFKAIRGKGQQIVVYGPSGSGKSTLLHNKLNELYDHHIAIRVKSGTSFEDVIYQAFCDLNAFFKSSSSNSENTQIKSDFTSYFTNVEATYSNSNEETNTRVVPLQLTIKNLSKYLSHFNACLVVEDFQKLSGSCTEELADSMKDFMDYSQMYRHSKIIAIGITGSAKNIVEYEPNMNNRVSEIKVPLMNRSQLKSIITKGEKLLNIKFEEPIKNSITHLANGLPSTVHHLCKNSCYIIDCLETQVDTKIISDGVFHKAMEMYIEESGDSIKNSFRKALRKNSSTVLNYRLIIIHALANFPNYGARKKELIDSIVNNSKYYGMTDKEAKNDVNWNYYLKSLRSENYGEIVVYNESTKLYRFNDIKLLNLAKSIFRIDNHIEFHSDIPSMHDIYDIEELFLEYLKEL